MEHSAAEHELAHHSCMRTASYASRLSLTIERVGEMRAMGTAPSHHAEARRRRTSCESSGYGADELIEAHSAFGLAQLELSAASEA